MLPQMNEVFKNKMHDSTKKNSKMKSTQSKKKALRKCFVYINVVDNYRTFKGGANKQKLKLKTKKLYRMLRS